MLVLTRYVGESIGIGSDEGITVTVLEVMSGGRVRLGVEAPQDVPVHRSEVWEAIERERKAPRDKGINR